MRKSCETCKHAIPCYGSFYISYVCDLFDEEVGISTIISDDMFENETTFYKCKQCKQAEVKDAEDKG